MKTTKTYIVFDSLGFFKIGRSKDFDSRYRQLKTANIHLLDIHYTLNGDYEMYLHETFSFARVRRNREWFSLCDEWKASGSLMSYIDFTFFHVKLMINMMTKFNNAKDLYLDIVMHRHIIK